ncbi:MAG: glycosyltransferase [Candidatus Nanopelagicales bacterium]|nr:glycosyltransferase family 2 protein [Candidatus Nanopelagicales bacterium]
MATAVESAFQVDVESTGPSIGVVVCAYTEDRWQDLELGVRELIAQVGDRDSVIVVIDNNPALLSRCQEHLAGPQVTVVANGGPQGLSGARNTGIGMCERDIVLFLDDDAFPLPGWIDSYRTRFASSQDVVAVGGAVEPRWEGGHAPRWFPQEFYWVVGCDYRGLPASGDEIRNPIGASMGIRRPVFEVIGTFNDEVGRVGALPVGCEETELCIRLRQEIPDIHIVRDTAPVVRHFVPKARQNLRYFASRCFHEGRSKAAMTAVVGASDGLSAERSYVIKTLVAGIGNHLGAVLQGDLAGLSRAILLPTGLAITTYGYVTGQLRARRAKVTT